MTARRRLVRALSFPDGTPAPLLGLIGISSSLVGVFFVPLLLPEPTPLWVRAVLSALVVFALIVLTAALLRRAAVRGRQRRAP
ncbi:hypothetical protein [Pseudonocardia alni]|uniref:hypothetical protein n=1 Tax=Pseudonocardia alni TaxID=33907 RepID=UPI00332324F9